MRVFLAVDVEDPQVRVRWAGVQSELAATGADLKLVEEGNLHFTLRFFGELTAQQVAEVRGRLEGLDARVIPVEYRALGVFPHLGRISVIWAGTDPLGGRSLEELANQVGARLADLRLTGEERFHPHVTLARVKTGREKARLVEVIRRYEHTVFGGERLRSLRLKQSVLTPRGPVYSDVAVFSFHEGGV